MKKRYIRGLMLIMLLGAVSEAYSGYFPDWRAYVPSKETVRQYALPVGAGLGALSGYGAVRYMGYSNRRALLGLLVGGYLGLMGGVIYDAKIAEEQKKERQREMKRQEEQRKENRRRQKEERIRLWEGEKEGALDNIRRRNNLQGAKIRVNWFLNQWRDLDGVPLYTSKLLTLVERVYTREQMETFLNEFDVDLSPSKNLKTIKKGVLGEQLYPQTLKGVLELFKNLDENYRDDYIMYGIYGLPKGARGGYIRHMIGLFGIKKISKMLNDVSSEKDFDAHSYTEAMDKHNKSTKNLVDHLIRSHPDESSIEDFIQENGSNYKDILINALIDFEIFKYDDRKIVFRPDSALTLGTTLQFDLERFFNLFASIIKPEEERDEYRAAILKATRKIKSNVDLPNSHLDNLNNLLDYLLKEYFEGKGIKKSRPKQQ